MLYLVCQHEAPIIQTSDLLRLSDTNTITGYLLEHPSYPKLCQMFDELLQMKEMLATETYVL